MLPQTDVEGSGDGANYKEWGKATGVLRRGTVRARRGITHGRVSNEKHVLSVKDVGCC